MGAVLEQPAFRRLSCRVSSESEVGVGGARSFAGLSSQSPVEEREEQ